MAGGVVALAAQSPKPAFEVASIKKNVSRSFPVGPEARPGGAFVSTNVALERVMRFAYDLPDYRIAGGPDWVRTETFDIEARAGRDVPPAELRQMLQALLEDRFQLVARREQREMSLYALLLRNDRQRGPNLRESPAGCAEPGGRGQTMEERRTPNGGVSTRRGCVPMAALAASLSSALQSPVDDRTALTGRWDYELSFTGERRRGTSPAAAAQDPNEAPALLTAVEEQLGLRLESRRGPVDVLVIESAARPTEN
jgi:uncharacterized protein (TIGR03435 family)